jgi:putative hydrolase of the HAD superfamily
VLLDGLGTLIALAPPGPLLVASLRRGHAIELPLADADRAFAAEMAYYREHHHEARDEETLDELRRRCAEVLASELPPDVCGALGGDELTAVMLESLRFSAQPDAARALAALRALGMLLIVVSNWDCGLARVLGEIGLAKHLDGVISSGAVGHPKPDPTIFRAALALAGVAPAEAVHVGDSAENDVRGALAVGARAVLLRRESADGGAAEPPAGVPVIGSLDELPSLIDGVRRLGSLH